MRLGGALRPVPEGLVEHLLATQADPDGAISQKHLFQAGDRVEEDFVIATGQQHSVWDFVDTAAAELGIQIR